MLVMIDDFRVPVYTFISAYICKVIDKILIRAGINCIEFPGRFVCENSMEKSSRPTNVYISKVHMLMLYK